MQNLNEKTKQKNEVKKKKKKNTAAFNTKIKTRSKTILTCS